jgi:hypothetical protein
MFKSILMLLLTVNLFSCGSDKKGGDKTTSSASPFPTQEEQPSPQCPTKKDDITLKVFFLPLSSELSPIEKERLVHTFKGLDEPKGYWKIIGHSFDKYFSLHRARVIEHFLREELKYDVVGVIEGKDYGTWGFVDVTFTYY